MLSAVTVDKSSDAPIYRQIVGQLNCIIHTEQFSPGQPLPTIRELAATLRINPNTVVRAYEELQLAGVITKRRGSGCVVSATVKPLSPKVREALLAPQIEQLIFKSEELGMSTADLLRLVEVKSRRRPHQTKPRTASTPSAPKPTLEVEQVSEVPTIWQPDEEFID